MKTFRLALSALLIASIATFSAVVAADKDASTQKPAKIKPYTLKKCLTSDEALGGDMGEPYVFIHKDREIKLCCKDCRKDFDKNPAKFVTKLEAAEKKAAASQPNIKK